MVREFAKETLEDFCKGRTKGVAGQRVSRQKAASLGAHAADNGDQDEVVDADDSLAPRDGPKIILIIPIREQTKEGIEVIILE